MSGGGAGRGQGFLSQGSKGLVSSGLWIVLGLGNPGVVWGVRVMVDRQGSRGQVCFSWTVESQQFLLSKGHLVVEVHQEVRAVSTPAGLLG
jgi:hypothetical protein